MSPAPRRRRAGGTLPRQSEAAWQQSVVNLALLYGWRVYHAPAGGKDGRVDREQIGAGFPDLVLIRPPELIVAELKPDKATRRRGVLDAEVAQRPEWLRAVDLTAEQAAWLEAFAEVGAAVSYGNACALELGLPHEDGAPLVHAYVWRPADLEVVHTRLSTGRHRLAPAG